MRRKKRKFKRQEKWLQKKNGINLSFWLNLSALCLYIIAQTVILFCKANPIRLLYIKLKQDKKQSKKTVWWSNKRTLNWSKIKRRIQNTKETQKWTKMNKPRFPGNQKKKKTQPILALTTVRCSSWIYAKNPDGPPLLGLLDQVNHHY